MVTVELDKIMQERGLSAWDAPFEARREAGTADIRALGVKAALEALVAEGWDEDQAADWLLEAALGIELAGVIVLLPTQPRFISVDEEAWLRYRAGRHARRDELVGLREAAEILNWDPRKVATYRARGSFPRPVAELAAGPVWLRSQIEIYKQAKEQAHATDLEQGEDHCCD
jgi:hypothetical protein